MATTTLTGTTGNNLLNAPGSVSTLVQGLQGADTINLALANDEAQGGKGSDTIGITRSGIVSVTVNGGDGNDTVFIRSANQFNGYIFAGAGNDSIQISSAGGALINGGSIYGGAGFDTIALSNNLTNAMIGGGENNDSLAFTGAAQVLTSSSVMGGQGADTIRAAGAGVTGSFASLNGGKGHDIIAFTGAGAFTNSLVAGGQGNDSISVNTTVASIAGGGLNDTIRIAGAYASTGVIYMDGLGTTTVGTGTEGAADGADLLTNTQAFAAGAVASIYGGGGADTISIIASSGSNLIDGGNGSDSIAINGLAGVNYSLGTITGGAGNDLLRISNTAVAAGVLRTGIGTITGGAGNDTIIFNNSATITSAAQITMSGNVNAIISGVSGDRLTLFTSVGTATFNTAGNTNWNTNGGANGTIFVLTAASAAATYSAGGSAYAVTVFSDGTDSFIQIYGAGAGDSVFQRIYVSGRDLVTTTNTGAVTATTTAFGFTVAANSNGGMNITFS